MKDTFIFTLKVGIPHNLSKNSKKCILTICIYMIRHSDKFLKLNFTIIFLDISYEKDK